MLEIQEVLFQASCFYEDADKYQHDITFPELQFSKGVKNYNRILNRLQRINLPDPKQFQYTTLTLMELKEYLIEMLTKILGPEYKEQIANYNELLKVSRIQDPFDSTLEISLEHEFPEIKNFYISDRMSSIQVASTSHEYIHGLLSRYITHDYNRVLSNIHYKELLSILIEYIVCFELSNILKSDNIQEKHNIIRLFTNQQHSQEHEATQRLSKELNKLPSFLANQYKLYVAYENHSSFGYITSDIYATRLFEFYQEDSKTLLSFMKKIIEGEKSIKDLLKHYNISLNNTETFIKYSERMEKIPKL